MTLMCSGDVHGDITGRFSYKRHPELRSLTVEDYVIVAGDFGAIWDWTGKSKEDKYYLDFLNSKPWTTIVVLGNHECWPLYKAMPYANPDFLDSGVIHQCVYMDKVYDNIFIVDNIATLNIEDNHILCIAGANSHDKAWRIEGKTWWAEEAIDVNSCLDFMEDHNQEYFDLIVSHDAPASINDWFSRDGIRYDSTYGQKYLESLRKELNFHSWITGHMHFDSQWPSSVDPRVYTLYTTMVEINKNKELKVKPNFY